MPKPTPCLLAPLQFPKRQIEQGELRALSGLQRCINRLEEEKTKMLTEVAMKLTSGYRIEPGPYKIELGGDALGIRFVKL